jgi:hypothetical protein
MYLKKACVQNIEQISAYCIIPFIQNFRKRKLIYSMRLEASGRHKRGRDRGNAKRTKETRRMKATFILILAMVLWVCLKFSDMSVMPPMKLERQRRQTERYRGES